MTLKICIIEKFGIGQNMSMHYSKRRIITSSQNIVSVWISAAYRVASAPSRVERIGIPSLFTMTIPCTPLCELIRLSVSSTSDI